MVLTLPVAHQGFSQPRVVSRLLWEKGSEDQPLLSAIIICPLVFFKSGYLSCLGQQGPIEKERGNKSSTIPDTQALSQYHPPDWMLPSSGVLEALWTLDPVKIHIQQAAC